MNREQQAVREFHQLIGAPAPDRPEEPSPERRKLRINLILEELQEFAQASNFTFEARDYRDFGTSIEIRNTDMFSGHPDLVEVADALGDLLVVVYGAGLEWGIDLEPIFQEIHRSNMTKGGGPVREDGKALKGPNYSTPELGPIIQRQIAGEPEPFRVTTKKQVQWIPMRIEDVQNLTQLPGVEVAPLFTHRDPGDETTHRVVVPLDLAR